MTAQEQLCKLIELYHEWVRCRAEFMRLHSELKELAQELMDAQVVDEQSVFFYQGQAYYLKADFEKYTGIGITPVRDLGAGR